MLAYKPKDNSPDLVVRVFVGQGVEMNLKVLLALRMLSESGIVGLYQLFQDMCLDMKSQMFVTLYRTGLNEVLR
jgi:hypothetical protein